VTLVVGGICISLYLNGREIKSSAQQVTQLKTQVSQRQQEFDRVATQASQLQTPFNQEAMMRNELLLQKPGEYIIQMPDLPANEPVKPLPSPILTPWQQWQQLLFSP
jgi:hypothetical protein